MCKTSNVNMSVHLGSMLGHHKTVFFLFSGTPLVIEGGLENWPAINWTLESLKEKVGGNEVNVRVNTNCEEYRVGVVLLLWMVVASCQRYYTTVIV